MKSSYIRLIPALIVLVVALAGVYYIQTEPKPVPLTVQNNSNNQQTQNKESQSKETEKQMQSDSEDKTNINDEPADWQTYRNEEWGVEFKYPDSLEEDADLNLSNELRLNGDQYYIVVGVSDKFNHCEDYYGIVDKKEIKTDDLIFQKVTSKGRMAESTLAYMVQYYSIDNGYCYYFEFVTDYGYESWYARDQYSESNLDYSIYDKIISTFKFIEP